jgi:hypothetical protein
MGINITYGYKLHLKDMNIDTLFSWINSKRESLSLIQEDYIKNSILDNFYENLDAPEVKEQSSANSVLVSAIDQFNLSYDISTKSNTISFANKADMYINFIPVKNVYYVIIHTDVTEIVNVFEKSKDIDSFNYWSTTDGPDSIPVGEWHKRGDEWNNVLGGDNNIYKNGFSVVIKKHPTEINIKSLIKKIVEYPFKKRLEEAAKSTYIADELKKDSRMKVFIKSNREWKNFDCSKKKLYKDKVIPLTPINLEIEKIQTKESNKQSFIYKDIDSCFDSMNIININKKIDEIKKGLIDNIGELEIDRECAYEIFVFIKNNKISCGLRVDEDSDSFKHNDFKLMHDININIDIFKLISHWDFKKSNIT